MRMSRNMEGYLFAVDAESGLRCNNAVGFVQSWQVADERVSKKKRRDRRS